MTLDLEGFFKIKLEFGLQKRLILQFESGILIVEGLYVPPG